MHLPVSACQSVCVFSVCVTVLALPVCVCVCLSVSACLFVPVSISTCVGVSACLCVSDCVCMCPSAYLCLLVCLCAFIGRRQTRKHKPSACADIPSGFRLLFLLPLSYTLLPLPLPSPESEGKGWRHHATSPAQAACDGALITLHPGPEPVRASCAPGPWSGDTGPLHAPLSKHFPPPVSRRKNPHLKPTSSALVIFRPFLASLLCHYFLVRRHFLRRLPRVLSTQSCQVLESLTLSLSLTNQLPTRPGILTQQTRFFTTREVSTPLLPHRPGILNLCASKGELST